MKDISKNIISKIKKNSINPKPKWHFFLKNWVFLAIFIFSIFVGGLSVGGIFFKIMTNEWDIARKMSDSFIHFVLLSLPYFWVFVMVVFSFLAHHYIRKTKKGYKYSVLTINLISISGSIILGFIIFVSGMSFHLHRVMHERVPMYDRMMEMHHELLMDKDKGILIGEVIEIGDTSFVLRDLKENEWVISTENVINNKVSKLALGERVIVIGQVEKKGQMSAEILRSGSRSDFKGFPLLERFREEGKMPFRKGERRPPSKLSEVNQAY